MGFKSTVAKPIAKWTASRIRQWASRPVEAQDKVLQQLIAAGRKTAFGRAHHFDKIQNYPDFAAAVPIRDYEQLKPWIERIIAGEHDVLWPGRPRYFAKTSGTTSGSKYIPITTESLPNHFGTARNALFNTYAQSGKGQWLDGKMIFLSGSPVLEDVGGIPTGRLSGIVNHLIPAWLRSSQLPSFQANCIEEWEEKVERIVDETLHADLRLISGIPPWVQMYYERLLARSGKETILEVFPNFSMFVYGGVNFEPYRQKLESLTGGRIDSVETYPASEGFIAFQDCPGERGLLLNVHSGIFFEFVPSEEIHKPNPRRLSLREVEPGVNYALIMHTNAGLWGYSIGDTVEFLSLDPPRIVVTGRVKHFISAFGEHVIGKEVEEAMRQTAEKLGVRIVEFSVAPQITPPEGGLPYHEWWVEFDVPPQDMHAFSEALDEAMTKQNIYYRDLIEGKILRTCVVRPLHRDAFRNYMRSIGRLGGQNKTPRLANDRKIADALRPYQL
jgi:hypothetical protein